MCHVYLSNFCWSQFGGYAVFHKLTETIDYGIAALDVGRVWFNFALDESAKFR